MPDRKLKWSERALEENRILVDYLLNEWGAEITQRVTDEIDQTVIRIQNNPEHFQIVKKSKNIRRCVASPQTSIYFKVSNNAIEIITLFDNRQNPKKRKL
ncbi:MAG: type II toxin-antitoxin system RelE/ParE family toxin [Mucilaginibacter sp.]|nr:type II toxin-antitoxin system RelE/ParE family toxin [Mucilaginibacter sp.]